MNAIFYIITSLTNYLNWNFLLFLTLLNGISVDKLKKKYLGGFVLGFFVWSGFMSVGFVFGDTLISHNTHIALILLKGEAILP